MRSKFLGGILLIVGTSIGGGMLALPVANATNGFGLSSLALLLCWVIMTLGALFILEVNLYLPPGKNILSMAIATLGIPGLLVAWVSYLLLLYALLSAYISGGTDVLDSLLQLIHVHVDTKLLSCLFILIFGNIVYGGIKQVDLFNRGLMFAKLGTFLILIILISPFIHVDNLLHNNHYQLTNNSMILITSFGFAIIVPDLRNYFQNDIKLLKKVVFIGSLLPLCCYIAWDAVIMGSLAVDGSTGLMGLTDDAHTTSSLAKILCSTVHKPVITLLFNFFTSVCMLTAFLGVSLCLISFLSDGLGLSKTGTQGLILFMLTFVPPLTMAIFFPGMYLYALNYAGIFCIILLLLLPALMSYVGRKKFPSAYQVPGGKLSQWLVIICSLILLFIALF
ncbi:MAG: amino acid permease [Legionella sp.]